MQEIDPGHKKLGIGEKVSITSSAQQHAQAL